MRYYNKYVALPEPIRDYELLRYITCAALMGSDKSTVIDTGISVLGADVEVEIGFKATNPPTSSATLFASSWYAQGQLMQMEKDTSTFQWSFISGENTKTGVLQWGTYYKLKQTLTDLYIDDFIVGGPFQMDIQPWVQCPNTLCIAGVNYGWSTNERYKGDIYFVKIWKAGVLVRDMVAAMRTTDNKACLYDKITDKLFMPDCDEQWSCGPVVENYTGFGFAAAGPFSVSFSTAAHDMMYRINEGEWTQYTTANKVISASSGRIDWKRNSSTVLTEPIGRFTIASGSDVAATGNIMSLLDGTNYQTMTDLTGWGGSATTEGIFIGLLESNTRLTNVQFLHLPATTLSMYCYANLLAGCTGITSGPTLPATTLAPMCYAGMFSGCTGLTTSPILKAPTLVTLAYYLMFYGCSNLSRIECHARTGFDGTNALLDWTDGVAASGTFVKKANVNWPSGTSGIPTGWTVQEIDDDFTGLTMLTNTAGNISFTRGDVGLEYKINTGNWTAYTTANQTIRLQANDMIRWRRTVSTAITDAIGQFTMTGALKVEGNLYSILDGSNYKTMTDLTGWGGTTGIFKSMFENCTVLNNNGLVLPGTTLPNKAYHSMFRGCTSLTTAPALPATTIGQECYASMFRGCTSLTTAPALPVISVPYSAYAAMFQDCTSIIRTPIMSATTLGSWACSSMYKGCTSMVTADDLLVTSVGTACCHSMYYGCTSLTQPSALPATTLANTCYSAMFYGCTSLANSPELPATTLANECYHSMFYGCTSLANIKCFAESINATNCLASWTYNVAASGTFTKKTGITWPRGTSGIPSGWTVIEA